MSLFAIGMLGLVICFVLIFLRIPIAIAFAATGFLGVWAVRGWGPALNTIATVPYTTASMYVWTVVPLFVLMGYLALYSGLAHEFFEGIRKWIGHWRGGLAMTVIFGLGAFGACTGDPVSAAVTFTSMSLPEMRKAGYKDKLSLGAVCAGGIVEALIPPSLCFIIYGALTETSIGKMFIAGIFPGVIIALLYIAVILFICWRDPLAGPAGPRATWNERWRAGTGMWSFIVVFGGIFFGIFAGIFTPTEAGAAGTFIVLVLALARRKLSWQGFKNALRDSGLTVGMVGFLLVGTMVFNTLLVVTGVPASIATFTGGITESPYLTMWIIVVALWILGCFVDAIPLSLIMIPILYPIAVHLGFDPIHFGIIFCVATLAGTLTPPFGIIVYAVTGTAKDVPLFDVFRGVAPFLVAVMVLQVLVIYLPVISTFLPSLMIR